MTELCCKFKIPELNTVGGVAETRTLLQSVMDRQMDGDRKRGGWTRVKLYAPPNFMAEA